MARRPQGVQSWVNATGADQAIKSAPGILYGVNVSWHGQSVGDRIVILDSTDGSGSPAKLFELIITTAAGHFPASLAEVGKAAAVGLYVNFQVTDDTKIKVSVDYD